MILAIKSIFVFISYVFYTWRKMEFVIKIGWVSSKYMDWFVKVFKSFNKLKNIKSLYGLCNIFGNLKENLFDDILKFLALL